MKTEQEQIEKMINILKNNNEVCHYISCIKCKYHDNEDCHYTSSAYALYQAGYGDVSEYKAEVERLKTEYEKLQTNAEILARGIRDFNHENYELTEKVKRAQTDTINTIVKYCENPNHWRELKDCKLFGGKSNDLRVFLNGIFKEVDV